MFNQSREGHHRTVKAGEKIAISGYGNQVGHLHLGMLLDNITTQADGTFLSVNDVRKILGYAIGERLPN